ncbi:MAG: hypothetical protein AB7U05_17245 [Mangrovibacterium sp.]
METVWDYNVTEEEQEFLTFHSKEVYQRLNQESSDIDLFLLFSYRGEKEKAGMYFNRLSEEVKRPFLMQDEFEF